jgi:hypothetical protein
MKTKNLFSLILIMMVAVSSLSVSCKSDDDGGGGGSAASGTITAKVDGSSVTTIEMTTAAQLSGGSLMVTGNDGGSSLNKAFVLTITSVDGTGTYPIGGGANIFNVASYIETEVNSLDVVTWQAPYDDSEVGEINITELTDSHVKGTFSFQAKNADGNIKNITEGSFNVNLQ